MYSLGNVRTLFGNGVITSKRTGDEMRLKMNILLLEIISIVYSILEQRTTNWCDDQLPSIEILKDL